MASQSSSSGIILPKNLLLMNLYSFIPQFIISGMEIKESPQKVDEIKAEIRTTIQTMKEMQLKGLDFGIFFYANCPLKMINEIETRLDVQFNRLICLSRNEMKASIIMNDATMTINLPGYSEIQKMSVILAHELCNTMGVDRIVIFGDRSEADDLSKLGAETYNIYLDNKVPVKDFTYMGLYFNFDSEREMVEIPMTIVAQKISEFILPIFEKINSKLGMFGAMISRWLK
jgi:hypothetical protein